MNGVNHISETFSLVRDHDRAALMPYYTLGYPTLDSSLAIIEAIANAGADLIELGIPFSDPLADGPTIQHSTQVALENGVNVKRCLELITILREEGVSQPFLLMGYSNPIFAYGVDKFVSDAAEAGADGFIIPDLPPEEANEMESICRIYHLAMIYLLAPTSTQERVESIAQRTAGFLYLVSLTGITGAREDLSSDLESFVSRVRRVAKSPLAVGFGISTPEQARTVGGIADGVIVGSALINAVNRSKQPCKAAGKFVRDLRLALEH